MPKSAEEEILKIQEYLECSKIVAGLGFSPSWKYGDWHYLTESNQSRHFKYTFNLEKIMIFKAVSFSMRVSFEEAKDIDSIFEFFNEVKEHINITGLGYNEIGFESINYDQGKLISNDYFMQYLLYRSTEDGLIKAKKLKTMFNDEDLPKDFEPMTNMLEFHMHFTKSNLVKKVYSGIKTEITPEY